MLGGRSSTARFEYDRVPPACLADGRRTSVIQYRVVQQLASATLARASDRADGSEEEIDVDAASVGRRGFRSCW